MGWMQEPGWAARLWAFSSSLLQSDLMGNPNAARCSDLPALRVPRCCGKGLGAWVTEPELSFNKGRLSAQQGAKGSCRRELSSSFELQHRAGERRVPGMAAPRSGSWLCRFSA